ncbi:MAG: alpha-2-macroglobulin, partial [Sphingobacteriales bacterium]|nr:alpha-2-macroglobulin [Sphingobacteriales bacterium]
GAITVTVPQNSVEPGNKAAYKIETGFNNIWLIHTISKMDTSLTTYQTARSLQPYLGNIIITEVDRGGILLNYAFVQHNRIYSGDEMITIPWSNKMLSINYETFRDKLQPGSKENWKVKITGSKAEKVAAEILVSMYDASLDQFKPHNWNTLNIWPSIYNTVSWNQKGFASNHSLEYNNVAYNNVNAFNKSYDELLREHIEYGFSKRSDITGSNIQMRAAPMALESEGVMEKKSPKPVFDDSDGDGFVDQLDRERNTPSGKKVNNNGVAIVDDSKQEVKARTNFNETAFFFPNLKTDTGGNVSFNFTIPEALTKWKLMTLAHTKDVASGYTENSIVTQKELMVQPNAPRFMREGDKIVFSAKVVNLTKQVLTGTAQLQLFDAATNKTVDTSFKNNASSKVFTVAAGQSIAVNFQLSVPGNFNSALTYRIIAKAGSFSDGEEMAIPVLTNRMLVTESMPLNIRGANKKDFKFEKLLNSNNSSTLTSHALTVEYTSNPAWYAVQALPYLMEYPYECAEQTFNRYYANILASFISNSTPKIKAVFERWRNPLQGAGGDTSALLSNLQKNEELKAALLQETPWVLAAQNENQQKKNIALLFDMVRMSAESAKALDKLRELQSTNGGFVWFKGGQDDRYMTQYILSGIGHLKKLNALNGDEYTNAKKIVDAAIPYLDKKIKEDDDWLVKNKVVLKNNNLSYTTIQYLYLRTFFAEYKIAPASQTAYNYYRSQAQQYWLSNSKYMQAMIALSLYRTGDGKTPQGIIKSLKEINGNDWLNEEKTVEIKLGNEITIKSSDQKVETGTGYFKKTFEAENVKPEMGNISVLVQQSNNSTIQQSISYGGIYWQYFEDLNKITSAETPLKLVKKLFTVENTDKGPVLKVIENGTQLKVGDKIKVRIELKADRDMEYVHMKDMRASCMEPINVLSEYKWQGGLGYYETTKDASTNFFFGWLPKGSYVFEYELFVANAGNFSNGITTIQCMYAPEFTSHSEGVRVVVQ